MRAGELAGLQWKDIDLTLGTLKVQRTLNRLKSYDMGANKTELVLEEPKTANSIRTIPLLSGAVEDLKRWRNFLQQEMDTAGANYTYNDLIFCNELGGFIEPSLLSDYYHRMLDKAHLSHFTFHALRHTFATRALEQRMDAKTLSIILGAQLRYFHVGYLYPCSGQPQARGNKSYGGVVLYRSGWLSRQQLSHYHNPAAEWVPHYCSRFPRTE